MKFKQNVVIYERCACLLTSDVTSEDCDKLFINLYHPEKNDIYMLGICRNHIRSRLHYRLHEKRGEYKHVYNSNQRNKYMVKDIIKDICKKVFDFDFDNIEPRECYNYNDLSSKEITINTCSRPYMYRTYNIFDAIYLNMKLQWRSAELTDLCIKEVANYIKNIKHKKYKTKYNECIAIMKRIENPKYGMHVDSLWIELFQNLLELRKN